MVANFGAVLDDRITFGPDIAHDDGVLDACVYSPRGLLDAIGIMWRLLRRDFRSSEGVLYCRGREIRIETDGAEAVQADGELLGTGTLHVVVEPLAADLLVPARRR
jgi:diacylglycerol kinase family enzyme